VLLALAQRDLKRLLAYSSVENVGVIAIGLGIGILGASAHAPAVAALGFAGALLHVWSHAIMKALLFFGAGSVLAATGTTDVERLGGLMRRMPLSGTAFAVGAAGICGLPPLAGFPGEFALLLASFRGVTEGAAVPFLLVAIAGLGLMGGLAVACFAKAVGVAFLGEPRSAAAASAHEPGGAMAGSSAALAAACVAVGLSSPLLLALARPAVETLSPAAGPALDELAALLWRVGLFGTALLATTVAVALGRLALVYGREIRAGVTWDCGYAAPASRMQYSGASFVQPITRQFEALLGASRVEEPPVGLFPGTARLESRAPDPVSERVFGPLFAAADRFALGLRWLQSGSVHRYVLYIVLATAALFLWKLG
jgi:NADH:ubiquinone oxidoreductase subunit 5 (subunit L)/multisubunit Na+/H+ antiporter MnhA subunit